MRRVKAADANTNAADGGEPEAPGCGLILGRERGLDNMYNTSVSKGLVTHLNKKLIKYTIDEREEPLLCMYCIHRMYVHSSIHLCNL